MITCTKCQEENPPELTACQKCGHTLLPGESFTDRLVVFIGGILGMGISIGMTYLLGKNPEFAETSQCCLFTRPEIWLIGIVAFPIMGIMGLLRKTPEYSRYAKRANRHLEIDPEQALADFSKALMLAPEKEKANLLKQRSALYAKLGKEENALQDKLEYIGKDEAYKGTSSFAQVFGLDSESMVAQARKTEQEQLITSSKVNAVGYCAKCQKAVVLNEKQKCPIHPKSKPYHATFVLPDKVESTMLEVEQKSVPELKKIKKNRTILIIILVVVLVACCVIPAVMGLLGNLLEMINPSKTPTSQEKSDLVLVLTEEVTPTLVSTPREEILMLQPNFLKDANTSCLRRWTPGDCNSLSAVWVEQTYNDKRDIAQSYRTPMSVIENRVEGEIASTSKEVSRYSLDATDYVPSIRHHESRLIAKLLPDNITRQK